MSALLTYPRDGVYNSVPASEAEGTEGGGTGRGERRERAEVGEALYTKR